MFFPETRNSIDTLDEIFRFFWPTAAAIWNLRISLMNHLRSRPETTMNELHSLYIKESGIYGVDLGEFYIKQDWESQKRRLAGTLLLEIFSVYESWLEIVVERILPSGPDNKDLVKALQYPTKLDTSQKPINGIRWALLKLIGVGSSFLASQVHTPLTKAEKYRLASIDSMLLMYRYFKEVRNCLIHRGAILDQRAVDAFKMIERLTLKDLGLDERKRAGKSVGEVPKTFQGSIGEKALLDLRGVVGMSELVIRIMVTVDAELSQASEKVFCENWSSAVKWQNFPSSVSGQKSACDKVARAMGIPSFPNPEEVVSFARSKRIAGP